MQKMINITVQKIINGCLELNVPNAANMWKEKSLRPWETLTINNAFIAPNASMCPLIARVFVNDTLIVVYVTQS